MGVEHDRNEFADVPAPQDCQHQPELRGGGKSGSTIVSLWQCPDCGRSVVKQHSGGDGTVLFGGWNAPEQQGFFGRLRDRLSG